MEVRAVRRYGWEHLTDDDLLRVRICDLGVRISGSDLEPRVAQLHRELALKGLELRPKCYLAGEWLSPDGQAAIGIPFFLAHPRLRSLEFRMMFEVEGGTASGCMKLLRHEAGHAFDHAFRLHRDPEWKRLFGAPGAPYNPYYYQVDPESKKHVRNLPDNYAQCHPSEDFAETFAVWLNPNGLWRQRYDGWPALRKLHYVNRTMRRVAERRPPRRRPVLTGEARSLRSTLDAYYSRKFRIYQLGDLSFAVRNLKEIFRVSRAREPENRASSLIRRNKRTLVESIAEWSGAKPGQVARVVATLAGMADTHRLVVRDDTQATLVRLATYVATLTINRMRTHSYRVTKP